MSSRYHWNLKLDQCVSVAYRIVWKRSLLCARLFAFKRITSMIYYDIFGRSENVIDHFCQQHTLFYVYICILCTTSICMNTCCAVHTHSRRVSLAKSVLYRSRSVVCCGRLMVATYYMGCMIWCTNKISQKQMKKGYYVRICLLLSRCRNECIIHRLNMPRWFNLN